MIFPNNSEGLGSAIATDLAKVMVRQWWKGGIPIADFGGWQEGADGERIALWTLLVPAGHHPVGSTVCAETIEKYL